MKFSRMEKKSTRPSQESNLGLQQTRLVLYQLSYWDQARSPTRTSDIFTILLLPSRSLETVDRKSFEHRKFLVLRPVPLKIAYFQLS